MFAFQTDYAMKRGLFILMVCVLLHPTVQAQEMQEINVARIDSFISHVEQYNQGAGKVSVFRSGKEIYQHRFGKTPFPGDTGQTDATIQYRIGSITKLFTATMIHQLFEKGELTPETTLDGFFPDMPQADNITIGHLLNHTSGLGDYVFKEGKYFFWMTKPLTEKELTDEIKAQGLLFQPGEKRKYSNSGYSLLAGILQRVYEKTYPEIIEEQLLGPLGLRHILSNMADDKAIAPSYHLNTHHEWETTREFYFPNVVGVGDLAATPEELNVFIQALFSGKILSPESVEKMKPTGRQPYGSGLMQVPFHTHTLYGHGGETFGTRSILLYDPLTELSIALCVHAISAPFNDIFLGILNGIYNQPVTLADYRAHQTYPVDEKNYPLYEGTYEMTAGQSSRLRVYTEGRDLMLEMSDQLPACLEAFGPHRFLVSPRQIAVEFQPDKQLLILTQKGKSRKFFKVE